jgi:rhodanese-related sulfurtransferase
MTSHMHRMLRIAIIAAAAFAVAAPASAAEKKWPDSVSAYVAKVRKTVQTTDTAGYLAAVKNSNGALLIDVREPSEYASGHVVGTINIPRGLLEFKIWKTLGFPKTQVNMDTKIYTQCKSGGRATLAAADLKKVGFTNVVAVVAPTKDFEKKGFPWEKPKK